MTPKEKAKFLVNDCYYQPLTLQLNVNNNSDQMWKYAKRCATILVNEILGLKMIAHMGCAPNEPSNEEEYWEQVMEEIRKL